MRSTAINAIRPIEGIAYIYLGIGGVLSFFYAIGALLTTPLLRAGLLIYQQKAFHMLLPLLSSAGRVIIGAILRVLLWAPDFVATVMTGKQSLLVWLFGMQALQ